MADMKMEQFVNNKSSARSAELSSAVKKAKNPLQVAIESVLMVLMM